MAEDEWGSGDEDWGDGAGFRRDTWISQRDKIRLVQDDFRQGRLEGRSQADLVRFLLDIRSEAQLLYHEKHFLIAAEAFSLCVDLGLQLQEAESGGCAAVSDDLLADIYVGKAQCAAKMDGFESVMAGYGEAIKRNNITAHYHMAVLLNEQGEHEEALNIARKGRQIAESKNKMDKIMEFDTIIGELSILSLGNSFKTSVKKPSPPVASVHNPFAAGLSIATSNAFSALSGGDASVKPKQQPVVAPTPKPVKANVKETFMPMQSSLELTYPFSGKLDFCLVCEKCFCQVKPGIDGIQQNPKWKHPCPRNILIVKERKGGKWRPIRERNKQVVFRGPFQLCKHYTAGMACRSYSCSFAHSEEEAEMWRMDREEQIDIEDFIYTHQVALTKGQTFIKGQQGQMTSQQPAPPAPVPVVKSHVPVIPVERRHPLQGVAPFTFPLKESHEFRILCKGCVAPTLDGASYAIRTLPDHRCVQDVLLVRQKGASAWHRVRPRRQHRAFLGKYAICRRMGCNASEMCHFAHNEEERFLWTQEKDGRFNVDEFIVSNRSSSSEIVVTLLNVIQQNPGQFMFLCRSCFFGSPSRLSGQTQNHCMVGHPWPPNKLLFHRKHGGGVTPIQERKFFHAGAFFLICNRVRYCGRLGAADCKYAHSSVERDVWCMERDGQGSRDQLVQMTSQQRVVPPAPRPAAAGQEVQASVKCPFRVVEVCQLCWSNGVQSSKHTTKNVCASKHAHSWSLNVGHLLIPANKVIKCLPQKLPTNGNFAICRYVQGGKSCQHGIRCQFAHSKEEVSVWQWMFANKVMTLEDLVAACKHTTPSPNAPSAKAAKPRGTVPQAVAPPREVVPPPAPRQVVASQVFYALPTSVIYCHYCSKEFETSDEWEVHCSSEEHIACIHSDEDHQWNHRPPPWDGKEVELCIRNEDGGMCQHSGKPDMYNLCEKAHSEEELEEWRERLEWRRMKASLAQKEGARSYTDMLSSEYKEAEQGSSVIADNVGNVHITCSTPLKSIHKEKHTMKTWVFKVISKGGKKLHKVSLLNNKDRLHFWLVRDPEPLSHDMLNGEEVLKKSNSNVMEYHVTVSFSGRLFGSFSQWVTFDFDARPVVCRKLHVDLLTDDVIDRVPSLRKNLQMDRWTVDNCSIRAYGTSQIPATQKAMIKYKAPTDVVDVVTQDSVGAALNQHNYVHKMHSLLRLEEFTQARLIASYNLRTRLELINTIHEGVFVVAQPGHLFAKVPLNANLSEDSSAGQLILLSVNSALLKPRSIRSDAVYEAVVLNKQNFDLDGKGRDFIYLSLSKSCVQELSLDNGDHLDVDIQFQMNREPFVTMHDALDSLRSTDILFPNVAAAAPRPKAKSPPRLGHLNHDQCDILTHIRLGLSCLPLVVCGPFGTGKTESLAQSAMALVEGKPSSRVLICTHSNSAADLYILQHLQFRPDISVCRVYFTKRWVRTVDPVVRNCCFESPGRDCFVEPSRSEVEKYQVVITTLSMAHFLVSLDLHGHFTHILIDEAAQALECEAIKPLVLANSHTCIVLAGDPKQMQPRVYSSEAQRQLFQSSLLERLYRHYDELMKHSASMAPSLLLRENYRTDARLLGFISEVFYGNPELLIARSELEAAPGLPPMAFHVAKGEETMDADGTSFYNSAEVQETVDQVAALYKRWPREWGERNAELIGVICPYMAQVQHIRSGMRTHRDLRGVKVETIANVQGKEFRAIFISTVRSSNLSLPSIEQDVSECSGHAGHLGFLSDQRLLNTAITRAKSFVGVVGNPVILCGVGACKSLWRSFLKRCSLLQSIHPDSITVQQIRQQVQELSVNSSTSDQLPIKPRTASEPSELSVRVFDESGTLEELGCLEQLPLAEDVLLQLTKESARTSVKEQVTSAHMVVRMYAGHAEISFREDIKTQPQPPVPSDRWLTDQFQNDPLHFVRCLVLPGLNQAQVLHSENPTPNVRLSVPEHLAVLSGDEVAVELTNAGGKVLSLLHRPFDPEGQLLVCCQADQPGSLRPLNADLSIIHVALPSTRVEKVEKGVLPVYAYTASGHLLFDHYEPCSGPNQLWVVHCLGWQQGLTLGIVLGTLPQAVDIDRCMRTLHLDYRMPNDFMPSTLEQKPSALTACTEAFDYRSTLTFTVQPTGDKALDCAISFTDLKDSGCFLLGLHIADVAQMVAKGSPFDQEAEQRGALIECPLGNSCLMLPEEFSHDQCSFVPGKDRRAISTFITINGHAKVVKVTPKRTLIRSDHALSPEDAQNIINSSDKSMLFRSLVLLSKTTEMWHQWRLGNDAHCSKEPPGLQMIREVQIKAAKLLGTEMLQKRPHITPMLIQARPNYAALDAWKEQHASAASNAVHLSRTFHQSELCQCTGPCAQIQSDSVLDQTSLVQVPKSAVPRLVRDPRSVLLDQPSMQPQVLLAEKALVSIQQPERFVCSADVVHHQDRHHFSLNAVPYVPLFGPLHSHIDLVTQRILGSIIDDEGEAYSTEEVRALCLQANAVSRRVRSHKEACGRVQACRALMQDPMDVETVVAEVNGSYLELACAQVIPGRLSLQALGVQEVQDIDITFRQVQLTWEMRIFDLQNINDAVASPVELSADWNLVGIPKTEWQTLLWTSVRGQDPDMTNVQAKPAEKAKQILGSVTCAMKLQTGSVVSMQVTSGLHNGTLAPTVQLVHLTPSVSVCAEHRLHAADCFHVGASNLSPLSDTYADVTAYQQAWRPVLEMEAVHLSQSALNSVMLQNVHLKWDERTKATFHLPESLCGKFSLDSGFACIRYAHMRSSHDAIYTWVGHCTIRQVDSAFKGSRKVHLRLQQSNCPLPNSTDSLVATVEMIPLHADIQLAELTLKQLPESSALVTNIVLGKPSKGLESGYKTCLRKAMSQTLTSLTPLTQQQNQVLKSVVEQSFCCVQGSASSGKTLLSHHLILRFVLTNRSLAGSAAVLLCVKDSETVNKIADLLKQHDFKPTVARLTGAYDTGVRIEYYERRTNEWIENPANEKAEIFIGTATTSSALRKVECNVTQVVIDDSHMCSELASLAAIAFTVCRQVVLFGDELALKKSTSLQDHLQRSLFMRYHGNHVQMQCPPYNMHRGIARFATELFDLALLEHPPAEEKQGLKIWPGGRHKPCAFLNSAVEEKEVLVAHNGSSMISLENAKEASVAGRVVRQLLFRFKVHAEDLAVLSPYEGQVSALRKALSKQSNVHVGSLAQASGGSWDIVIVSLVRSSPECAVSSAVNADCQKERLGASADKHVLYTALTRARKGLILIGDRSTLSKDNTWGALLSEFDQLKQIVPAEDFLAISK